MHSDRVKELGQKFSKIRCYKESEESEHKRELDKLYVIFKVKDPSNIKIICKSCMRDKINDGDDKYDLTEKVQKVLDW